MSLLQRVEDTYYPESDGRPMGETDVHIEWTIRIRDILKYRYRDQRVYVASNLLVYYQQGEPYKFVVPDDFVVLECDAGPRRTFKTWEEEKSPDVVFEVTSRSSRDDDQAYKPQVYSRIGVGEYFLYDPTAEYLIPPLQGFRLQGSDYVPIQADDSDALVSTQLGIALRLVDGELLMCDLQSGKTLLTAAEASAAERRVAEIRVAELEMEVERLRAELEQRRTKD